MLWPWLLVSAYLYGTIHAISMGWLCYLGPWPKTTWNANPLGHSQSQPWVPGTVGCQVQDSTVLSWTYRVWINNDTNVVKTIINHPQTHHFYGWYTPFPVMGSLWHCLNHISLMAVALAMTLLDSSYILAATWTSTLMGSKVKNFQMLFIKSKTRPISHTLYTLIINMYNEYIHIKLSNSHLFTHCHCSDLFFPNPRWLNMAFINSPHGSHLGTDEAPDLPEGLTLDASTGRGRFLAQQVRILRMNPVVIFMEPYSSHWNKQGELTYESDSWVVSPTKWIYQIESDTSYRKGTPSCPSCCFGTPFNYSDIPYKPYPLVI